MEDPETLAIIKRVHELSQDLREVEGLRAPSIREIATAPLIENWQVGFRAEPALIGEVRDHPSIRDGWVKTSGLYLVDRQMGYARLLSRWYRLGEPAKAD